MEAFYLCNGNMNCTHRLLLLRGHYSMLEGNVEKSKADLSTANDHAGELRLGGRAFDMNDPDSRKAGTEALKAAITDPNCMLSAQVFNYEKNS